MRQSAVSVVRDGDLVLAIWNEKYQGWVLPGGKVEPGESVKKAQARELEEEAGLATKKAVEFYSCMSAGAKDIEVHFFCVEPDGKARQMESKHPILWLTREALVACSPFTKTLRPMFEELDRCGL